LASFTLLAAHTVRHSVERSSWLNSRRQRNYTVDERLDR
jgi:hypothetical protein